MFMRMLILLVLSFLCSQGMAYIGLMMFDLPQTALTGVVVGLLAFILVYFSIGYIVNQETFYGEE